MKPLFVMAVAMLLTASRVQAEPYRAPRTPFGQPDVQGIWTNLSLTTLERPKTFDTLVVPSDRPRHTTRGMAGHRLRSPAIRSAL